MVLDFRQQLKTALKNVESGGLNRSGAGVGGRGYTLLYFCDLTSEHVVPYLGNDKRAPENCHVYKF